MAFGTSVYLNATELRSTDVPKDNPRFVREEIRKDSAGNTIEIRRYFLGMDDVEYYFSKLFYQGDPAAAVAEDTTKRITIYPWTGPM
jgi:hypothetical protein